MTNIWLIVLDTLRNDFSAPIWEILKKRGFIRYKAIAPSFWTVPSHASFLTGLYPSVHGVHETEKKGIIIKNGKKIPRIKFDFKENLVKILRDMGYKIYWLTANAWITPQYGFPRPDFLLTQNIWRNLQKIVKEDYEEIVAKYLIMKKKYENNGEVDKGGFPIKEVLSRLNVDSSFIFANFMEAHEPYKGIMLADKLDKDGIPIKLRYHPKNRKEMEKRIKKEYLREVVKLSLFLKEALTKIKDEDLVVILSDHGQSLGEREVLYHAWGLFPEIVEVPLFIRYPNKVRIEGKGVISLIKVFDLILKFAEGELKSDSTLFNRFAFSEMFGPYLKVGLKDLERKMIAVYSENSRIIYDVQSGSVEDFSGKNWKKLIEVAKEFSNLNSL